MKLNGHLYMRDDDVVEIIEDVVAHLVAGDYVSISSAIKDIHTQNAKEVASQLYIILNKFVEFFKAERYIRYEDAVTRLKDAMYDSKKTKVALFVQGAYGIKTKADDETRERYIFNVCLHMCVVKLEELHDSML